MTTEELNQIARDVVAEVCGEKNTVDPLHAALNLMVLHKMRVQGEIISLMSVYFDDEIPALERLAQELPQSEIPKLAEVAGWLFADITG